MGICKTSAYHFVYHFHPTANFVEQAWQLRNVVIWRGMGLAMQHLGEPAAQKSIVYEGPWQFENDLLWGWTTRELEQIDQRAERVRSDSKEILR